MKIVPVFPLPVSDSRWIFPHFHYNLLTEYSWTKLSLSVLNFSVWARSFPDICYFNCWLCLPLHSGFDAIVTTRQLAVRLMRFPENEVVGEEAAIRLKLVGSQPKDWESVFTEDKRVFSGDSMRGVVSRRMYRSAAFSLSGRWRCEHCFHNLEVICDLWW